MARRDENKVLADYLAQAEQESVAELRTMAETYYAYYAVCRQAGFIPEQAMTLVVAMQSEFLRRAQANARETDDGE